MEKNKNKLIETIAVVLVTLLAIFGLIVVVIAMAKELDTEESINAVLCLSFLSYLLVIFYAVYGYRVPHGNLLRVIVLIYSAVVLVQTVILSKERELTYLAPTYVALMCACYMAGRLHKFKENIIICGIIMALLVFAYVFFVVKSSDNLGFVDYISYASQIIEFLAIAISYITRFKSHIKAGLEHK